MPGKRPRPSLCAGAKPRMEPTCCHGSFPASSSSSPSSLEAAKCEQGVPQRVVVGFDVGETSAKEGSSNAGFVQTCRSPRSVLEADALSDADHPPAPSLRSVLDRLLSRPARTPPSKMAICASSIAAIRAEVPSRAPEADIVMRESPAAIAKQTVAVSDRDGLLSHEMLTPSPNRRFRGSVFEDGFSIPVESKVKKKEQLPAPVQASIFTTPSSVSHLHSHPSTADFLSLCFGCKCSLLPGKDIFMYRGDKAFCSPDCRHQQIVVDEQKERQSSSTRGLSAHVAHDSRLSIAAAPRRWL